MWRRHPDNDTPAAWRDLLQAMEEAIELTEGLEVMLAVEPEVSKVVHSARDGRALLDEIGSPTLKVCMDGANLFHTSELPRMRQVLDEAFDLLGADIALAHAKDLDQDGETGHLVQAGRKFSSGFRVWRRGVCEAQDRAPGWSKAPYREFHLSDICRFVSAPGVLAAGTGLLDSAHYLTQLRAAGFDGALFLHSQTESQVPRSDSFISKTLSQCSPGVRRTATNQEEKGKTNDDKQQVRVMRCASCSDTS